MLGVLLDPVGFVADVLTLANAFGFDTPAQRQQAQKILDSIHEVNIAIEELQGHVTRTAGEIKEMIIDSTVVEVQSRLHDVKSFTSFELVLLIKLLFCIRRCAPNVVFAIIVKYEVDGTIATLGFAGMSSDAIEVLVRRIEDFFRSLKEVKEPKTAYITTRIRGKYESTVENRCNAALAVIATAICSLSRSVKISSSAECRFSPKGDKTLVLLEPKQRRFHHTECDKRARAFLIGDTRSGKSTLGNALLKQDVFQTSIGITGTVRIDEGERVEIIEKDVWVTEVYDTPGLNDMNNLDAFYLTSIEDKIRILQRASALIMTVRVDGGITNSMFSSLDSYRKLFGDTAGSMVIVVLTINNAADKTELEKIKKRNWPTVSRLDRGLKIDSVFCVSLFDVRLDKTKTTGTHSHLVVEQIAEKCRSMPMTLIESIKRQFFDLREALRQKSQNVDKHMDKVVNDGWQAYDQLTMQFEASPFVKMTSNKVRGFVMKKANLSAKVLAVSTAGIVNVMRKTVVTLYFSDEKVREIWQTFYKNNKAESSSSDLMQKFGDVIFEANLGVLVRDDGISHVGTLRVTSFSVKVFDPANLVLEQLVDHMHKITEASGQKFAPDVTQDLFEVVLPVAVKRDRRPRRDSWRASEPRAPNVAKVLNLRKADGGKKK